MGPYAGRKVFNNLNFQNPNADAERIGNFNGNGNTGNFNGNRNKGNFNGNNNSTDRNRNGRIGDNSGNGNNRR